MRTVSWQMTVGQMNVESMGVKEREMNEERDNKLKYWQ
jgi:hypothetical protein